MDRINGAGTVDIGSGRRGFRRQNAAAGINGTEFDPAWFNGVQEELLAVIAAGGLAPDAGSWTQVRDAIAGMIAAAFASHPQSVHFGTDTGGVNALVAGLSPPIAALTSTALVIVWPSHTNSSTAVTLAADGLAPKAIVRMDGSAPAAGEIVAGAPTPLMYDPGRDKWVMIAMSKAYIDAAVATAVADRAFGGRMSLKEQYASGVTGPTMISGAWTPRAFNAVEANTIAGASVSGGNVTLPAGTYRFDLTSYQYNVGGGRLVLVDVGSGTTILYGVNMITNTGDDALMSLSGIFTLSSTKTLQVKFYCNNGNVTLSAQAMGGVPEVFMSALIERVS